MPKSTRDILEAAILADPDDKTAFAAYADHLQELGDPRGEFISVQLALEGESLPRDRRIELRQRERRWLERHEAELLGPELAARRGNPDALLRYEYRRGFLHGIEVTALDRQTAMAVRDAPAARWLRKLAIEQLSGGSYAPLTILTEAGFRESLRSFQFGITPADDVLLEIDGHPDGRVVYQFPDHILTAPPAVDVASHFPKLEHLLLYVHGVRPEDAFRLELPHLQTLEMYHFEAPVELEPLVENPAMGKLETLLLHPRLSGNALVGDADLRDFRRRPNLPSLRHLALRHTGIGNRGVEYLIRRGWLRQLQVLDLRHSRVGNAGAQMLAATPTFAQLSRLDLACNRLTKTGVRALQDAAFDTDVTVNLVGQQHPLSGPDGHLHDPAMG